MPTATTPARSGSRCSAISTPKTRNRRRARRSSVSWRRKRSSTARPARRGDLHQPGHRCIEEPPEHRRAPRRRCHGLPGSGVLRDAAPAARRGRSPVVRNPAGAGADADARALARAAAPDDRRIIRSRFRAAAGARTSSHAARHAARRPFRSPVTRAADGRPNRAAHTPAGVQDPVAVAARRPSWPRQDPRHVRVEWRSLLLRLDRVVRRAARCPTRRGARAAQHPPETALDAQPHAAPLAANGACPCHARPDPCGRADHPTRPRRRRAVDAARAPPAHVLSEAASSGETAPRATDPRARVFTDVDGHSTALLCGDDGGVGSDAVTRTRGRATDPSADGDIP